MNKKNIKDLTNQTFGKLTALYPLEERQQQHVVWHCLCSCGNECDIRSDALLDKSRQSCGCLKQSIGEFNIQKILIEYNFNFIQEKTFDNCINPETNYKLRYDFYLPDYNRLIEFDGEQHFKYTGAGWNTKENFEKTQKLDKIKNEYALNNNYSLVRIPYWERDNITLDMLLGDKHLITNTDYQSIFKKE